MSYSKKDRGRVGYAHTPLTNKVKIWGHLLHLPQSGNLIDKFRAFLCCSCVLQVVYLLSKDTPLGGKRGDQHTKMFLLQLCLQAPADVH